MTLDMAGFKLIGNMTGFGVDNTTTASGGYDNLVVKDGTIEGFLNGARLYKPGGTINNIEFNNVTFKNNKDRGIEIHNATTVTDLRVLDCLFDNNKIGIRWASSGVGNGVLVDGSTFTNHSSLGIYQANDGSTGYVRDLTITNSTFTNNNWAVYGEELRDVLVTGNIFQDQARGFYLWRAYNGAGVLAGDITVSNNEFHDHTQVAIRITGEDLVGYPNPTPTTSIDLPVMITGNTITADAGLMDDQWAQILIQLFPVADHAAVTVEDNTLTFSGTFAAATASHGITLQGDPDAVTIKDNTLNGGNVGGEGGTPPTSGIYIVSNHGYWGAAPAGATLTATCNTITGFVNGVSIYDESASAWGGLPFGTSVNINFNNINSNSSFGIRNNGAGTSETIDATYNWWGDAFGPSGVGPGSGDAVSNNVDYDPWETVSSDDCDFDNDGVIDTEDYCLGTVADVPSKRPGKNRWIWDGIDWYSNLPGGGGPEKDFTMDDTLGCSCEQILAILEEKTGFEFDGHYKFGCASSILEDWISGMYYLETVEVPASEPSPGVNSQSELMSGVDYLLKATGVAFAGDTIYFDAKFSITNRIPSDTWTDPVSGYESYGPTLLDLFVNGSNVDWGAYNAAHEYWYELAGGGNPVSFYVYDIYYPNNTGSLSVDINVKLW